MASTKMIQRLLFVFIIAIITEACYTCYAYYVARGDQVRGPLSAMAIAVGKGILVVSYVREPLMIAALAVGQGVGTLLTLKLIKSRKAALCPVCGHQMTFEPCRDCQGTSTQRSPRILTKTFKQVPCHWCKGEGGFWICPNAKNHPLIR